MSIKTIGRARSLTVHRYLGLFYGAYLCMMGLTGTVIVFSDEISQSHVLKMVADGAGQSLGVPSLAYAKRDDAFARISKNIEAVESSTKRRVVFYKSFGAPDKGSLLTLAQGKVASGPSYAFVKCVNDRAHACLLDNNAPDWLRFIIDLHHNLLCGKIGRTINGGMAVLLLVLLLSGALILTFQNGYWKSFTAAHRSRWPLRARNAHIVLGGCNGPFLALMAICAIYFGFPDQIKALLGIDFKPLATDLSTSKDLSLGLRKAFGIVPQDGKMPTPELDSIAMSKKNNRAVRYWFKGQMGLTNEIWMDGVDGPQLAGTTGPARFSRESLLLWFARFHFGQWAGLFSKCMWVILGWMPVALYATGCWMWRKKSKWSKKSDI
jgi:uncharacterized iron-regulated membrane protein